MKKQKGKLKQTESSMAIGLCDYIKLKYPDVIFSSESSGVRVNIWQASRMKRQRSIGKLPDLIIMEPRDKYHGMALELKASDKSPFLQDGSLSIDKHVREQAKMLDRLKRKGYWSQFIVGLDEGRKVIDQYMSWD